MKSIKELEKEIRKLRVKVVNELDGEDVPWEISNPNTINKIIEMNFLNGQILTLKDVLKLIDEEEKEALLDFTDIGDEEIYTYLKRMFGKLKSKITEGEDGM